MANAEKTAAVAELAEAFRTSSGAVLTEYRGMTVAHLQQLRRALAGNATYTIAKNTLTQIAARDAGVAGLDDLLVGPSAIAFVTGDPVVVAKGLRDFSRTHPVLVIKGGVLDGRALTADEVRRIADLQSREVLLAQLAGAMKASLSQAVGLFAAPLSQMARLAAALLETKPADPANAPGEPAQPAAAQDAEQGDAERGDAERGDAEQGDAEPGDAEQGDAEQGDAAPAAEAAEAAVPGDGTSD